MFYNLMHVHLRPLHLLTFYCSVFLFLTFPFFQDAARYRDELKDIAPHSLLKCSSDATTLVWDLVIGRFLQTRAFPLPITAIVVDPTEMKLFSGGIDC
ncbi:unnamed protein product [Camellia sinensis]